MRFIQKNPEPVEFTTWKQQANDDWQPSWNNNFQKPEKTIVHEALLTEQGHICCYCGQRITQELSHIEHFKPRTSFPSLSLSYDNLLASCPGYPEEEAQIPTVKPAQEFCGQKKGAWYEEVLTVSPLQKDCASYFRYTASGEVLPNQEPSKEKAAIETIANLGLSHVKLQGQRRKAIEGILTDLDLLSDADIEQLIQGYDRPDSHGFYTPFCATLIYILQTFLPSS